MKYRSAALSGLLLALAFPPFNFMLLAFVALVPFLISIRGDSYKSGFAKGYVFGLVFALPNMFWLYQFVARWTHSVLLGAVPWLIVSAVFALYYAAFGGAAAKAWSKGWPWAIPLLWAGVEAFRSLIPYLFFPWSLLAASQWKLPAIIQSGWWAGPYFVSAWVCTGSVLAVLFWLKWDRPRVVLRLTLSWLIILIVSVACYVQPITGSVRTVAAVQPGIDLAFSPQYQQNIDLARAIPEAMKIGSAAKRDLVVLPEGIADWPNALGQPRAAFPLDFTENVVLGGQRGDGVRHQSAFAFDGKWQAADKVRLVIFGEYVPFRKVLPFLSSFNLPGGDLLPGDRVTTMQVGNMKVGALLCFEALFEEVAREHAQKGAEVLAVLSLDDWYQNTGAIDALRAGAVLRAIENRMPVVRSAPLGPSMIIDARGNIVAQAKPGKMGVAQAQVLVSNQEPFFMRAVFPWLAIASLVLISFWPTGRRGLPTAAATAAKSATTESPATKA